MSTKATNVLWVVRHAKADYPKGSVDFDRPLAERGHKQTARMTQWLVQQPDAAHLVISSAARRAAETAESVRRAFHLERDALFTHQSLYLAHAEDMLDALRALPDDTGNVAMVGHNPGITHFVNLLTGSHELTNLPTFGIAKFSGIDSWNHLAFGEVVLEAVVTPKILKKGD